MHVSRYGRKEGRGGTRGRSQSFRRCSLVRFWKSSSEAKPWAMMRPAE